MRSTYLLLLLMLSTGLTAQPAEANNVYKWEDENGTIHYTAYPPKNRDSEKVKTYKGKPESDKDQANGNIAGKDGSDSEQSPEAANNQPPVEYEKDPERCSIAKQNLNTLKQHARVRIKEENGDFRYLTRDEHEKRMKKAQQAIKESCE